MKHTAHPLTSSIILGLDPGLARIGYGVISLEKGKYSCVSYGCLQTQAHTPLALRLQELHVQVKKLVDRFHPTAVGIEKLFFSKNTKTALEVSHARGVILMTLAQVHIPIHEFTPLQVKLAVVGYGKAEKHQVQKMVKLLLSLSHSPRSDDAADALAVALCVQNNNQKL